MSEEVEHAQRNLGYRVKQCLTVRHARGKPDFHLCLLPRDHWSPHACTFCGWGWPDPVAGPRVTTEATQKPLRGT